MKNPASGLPPTPREQVLEGPRRKEGPPARSSSWKEPIAVCCFVLAGCELLFALSAYQADIKSNGFFLFFSGATLIAPALVLLRATQRWVYVMTAILLVLVSAVMALPLLLVMYKLDAPSWFRLEAIGSRVALTLALLLARATPREAR